MPPEYKIESEPVEIAGCQGRIFRLAGHARADATEELELATHAALSEGVRYFVLDFAEAEYISSGVLRILLTLRKATRQIGGGVRVAALHAHIRESVFDALGFSKLFNICANVEEAVRDIGESDNDLGILPEDAQTT